MLLQQRGGHGEISVGIEGFTGAGKTLSVVTQVGLSKTDIDPLGVMQGERLKQGVTGGLASGEAVGCSGDVQGPRPGQQSTTDVDTTLLQGNREQHRRRDVGVMRRQLVGRRRKFVSLDGEHRQQERNTTQSRRCHCPFTC
ncbi:hypothetical protein D3C76_868540 [compost metagenome]